MTIANPLHLPDDDVVVDMTTAPEEWAFFPAHVSRIGRRGRLKLIRSARDEGPRADAGDDVPSSAEPRAVEALSDEGSADREPVHEASAPDEPAEGDHGPDSSPALATDEPLAIEISPPDVTDDEPTVDDEPVDEPPHVSDVTPLAGVEGIVEPSDGDEPSGADAVAETVAPERAGRSRAQRKPTQRKPAQHKPTQHKPTQHKPTQHKPTQRKPAARKTSASTESAAGRLRAARRAASVRVRAAGDGPPAVADNAVEPTERRSTAKRLLLAALVVVVASVGAGSWHLYLRDEAPATPEPTASVDPLSSYAQGEGGVTAGSKLGFRAVFPGSPERDTYRLPGPDEDSKVRFDSLSFRSSDVEFEAVRIALPASVDVSDASSVLRNATDTSARIRKGSVEEYGELMANGDRAAASIVSTEDGSYVQSQAILHEQTLYLVRIESKERTHEAFNRFRGEFEIV